MAARLCQLGEGVDSPTFSTFSASQILPEGKSPTEARSPGFETPPDLPMSSRAASRSVSPPSVFDANEEQPENYTDPTALNSGSDDAPGSYDLKPPPPSVSQSNIEALSERFFSADHLNIILRDPTHSSRFTKFLNQYKPHSTPTLVNYIETQKAIAAVEYANAIADRIPTSSGHPPYTAASLDDRFEARVQRASESLVNDALPAFVTHKLVHLVTDTLVKEIIGNNSPLMREMIPSLAEVYCITDPSLPDNPIVYASEEFYNTSQYGREYVIGRNCRFLQGPKTVGASIKRLAEALAAGQEITETVLN
ncbi:hypothetical protein M8818_006969 [Zalaria obscura]|uniref:Uncharacterized protein n=1 Tax=Zalaria obscura TaxID=2024903 RepID=A0ACC3S6I3_9PEZI